MGKKYIIELEDVPFTKNMGWGTNEQLYRVKGFNSLVFGETGLSKLTPYEELNSQEKPFNFADRLNEALGRFWDGGNDDFAKACGIHELVLSNYLCGHAVPTPRYLAAMAKTLDVSTDYLVGLEDNP